MDNGFSTKIYHKEIQFNKRYGGGGGGGSGAKNADRVNEEDRL